MEYRTLGSCLDESHCYTLEVSFFSYQTNTTGQSMPYTEEAYMKLGRNVARTFLDYYKLVGYISIKPSSGLTPKPSSQLSRSQEKYHSSEKSSSEPLSKSQGENVSANKSDKKTDRLGRKSS
ncbi:cytosolic carboxypeptidase 6 [Biomphalaria glabrata]|nr:cytosolic carboxypeptidase 6 [Biomphalaria glabrata]